jgi:predicted PurR-regulated permease PerM
VRPGHPSPPQDSRISTRDESDELRRIFVAPGWLRDAGVVAWLLVGIVLVVAGAIWLLTLTSTIVMPVLTATIIAAVGAPVIAWLERRRVPRVAGSGLLLLGILALAVVIGAIVLGGITSQSADAGHKLNAAADKIATALKDAGVGDHTTVAAKAEAKSSITSAAGTLLEGVAGALTALASLAAFSAFTLLSLFFLLKDGPTLRDWIERHAGVPRPVAHTVIEEMLRALRGYFRGVTAVAIFNAVVIGLGALIIGVPLAGTIAIVTFLGAYVPYLGAWTAGAFAVLIALGAQGAEGALAMAVIALLANGALQQLVQPFAFGAALDLHPLVVLIVTIAAGSLFGMIGLVLAAPVTSAIVHITHDLSGAEAPASAPAG